MSATWDVSGRGFVKGGTDDFAFDRAGHVCDFFGALVDEEDDERDFGMVLGNGVGNFLQEHGFARERGGDDHAALAFADWGEEIP